MIDDQSLLNWVIKIFLVEVGVGKEELKLKLVNNVFDIGVTPACELGLNRVTSFNLQVDIHVVTIDLTPTHPVRSVPRTLELLNPYSIDDLPCDIHLSNVISPLAVVHKDRACRVDGSLIIPI